MKEIYHIFYRQIKNALLLTENNIGSFNLNNNTYEKHKVGDEIIYFIEENDKKQSFKSISIKDLDKLAKDYKFIRFNDSFTPILKRKNK